MKGILNADTEARRRIREDIDVNFFVEAGAGSGKTTALVDRMAAMVESGIEIEKICAITFTVAASREFFDRFQQKLSERRAAPGVPEIVRERIHAAIRNIDLCFMGTIDSFCNQILGEHPARAGVPSAVSLIEDTEKTGIYRREYAKLKRGEYGPEMAELFREFCAVQDKPDDAFLACIDKFMDAHASCWVIPEKPEKDWREAYALQLDQLLSALEIIAQKQENLSGQNLDCRKAKDYFPEALRVLRDYRKGSAFPDVLYALNQITAPDDDNMKGLTLTCEPGAIGIETESLFSMRGKTKKVYCLTLSREGGLIQQLKEYQYTFTVRFLLPFAVKMAETLKRKGELSFYDHLLYLRNMLRDDAAAGGRLVRHIRSHYSHFLIDEFQDTDPLQAEVFFRLASEIPTEDWRDVRPVPGSLFIVGDPKQSIYRFRGADVNSYLSVKQLFVPPVGEVLSLQQNFRSCGELRRWFNDTFSILLPEETFCQSKFESIPIGETAEEDGLFSGAWNYRTTKAGNARDVAAVIRRLVNNPDILIQTPKEKKKGIPPHMIRYKDIMIITRTTYPLKDLLSAMKEYGIPYRVNGRTTFSECPIFVTLTELISVFADPSNSMAVYRALRGRLFGFSREEITEWVMQGNRLRLYGHELNVNDDISAALTGLNEFRKRSIMLSPSALCQAALEEFQLFQRCGTEDMEYVWFAVELLRNGADNRGSKSLTDAAMLLNNLADSKTDTEKVLDLSEDSNRVFLANLHKVKGLEAPVVILAQTELKKRDPDVHMEADGTAQRRWALKLSDSDSNFKTFTYAGTGRYKDEEKRETINLQAEETRLMYVAATRAGCALLIPETGGKECLWDSLRSAGTKDLSEILPPLPDEPAEPADFGQEQDPGEWTGMVRGNPLLQTGAETESWKISQPSKINDSDLEPEERRKPDPDADLPRGETSSLLLGTVIHRTMELLVSSGASLSDEAIIRIIREEYGLEDSAENEEALSFVRTALATVRRGGWKQEPGIPADILSELLSADEVYCEVPFCVSAGSSLTNGVMDVVYRKGDRWHVIDYKTNAEPCGLDQVYQDQLDAYRSAMRQLFGTIADVHTYHIPLLR